MTRTYLGRHGGTFEDEAPTQSVQLDPASRREQLAYSCVHLVACASWKRLVLDVDLQIARQNHPGRIVVDEA